MSAGTSRDVEILRQQARLTDHVVRANLEGVSQEDSLAQPSAGNCLNWVLGHLVCIYGKVLPMLGQEPVMEETALERYDRGSAPLRDPSEALPIDELLAAWMESSRRMDAGLAALPAEALERPAQGPDGQPETVRSLLGIVAFHQSYHAGQTGVLRRVSGKPGAIR